MKTWVISALLLAFSSSAMAATDWSKDKKWRGSGWYTTTSDFYAGSIETGPHSSEQACKEALPSQAEQDAAMDGDYGFMYTCENLQA